MNSDVTSRRNALNYKEAASKDVCNSQDCKYLIAYVPGFSEKMDKESAILAAAVDTVVSTKTFGNGTVAAGKRRYIDDDIQANTCREWM